MHEIIEDRPDRVLLAGLDTGEFDAEVSLDELEELVKSAGGLPILRGLQKRAAPDAATCMGSGRLEELAQIVETQEIDVAVFDLELTATQLRNIEQILGCGVMDRTMLILDIFADRARSAEGRLQVELARLRYRLPRLAGRGKELSRIGGGGAGGGGARRGAGETQLETDRRHIRRRITALQEQLEELTHRRTLIRTRREKDGIPTVAIVGYTNVGKSTLLNKLTGAGVLAEDKLFATLDPTARALSLPDGRNVMLIDTVGLVRRLPHHLVEAFHSTLEEAAKADLVLNVCDASDPEALEQQAVTLELLKELDAEQVPVMTVFNKCDRTPAAPLPFGPRVAAISAITGEGLEDMLAKIAAALPQRQRRMKLLLPYGAASLENRILEEGKIFSREYTGEGVLLDALVDVKLIKEAGQYEIK